MTELLGTMEETEKLIEERIVRLRRQIEDEKAATHERCLRIEQQSKERIRDARRDFVDRVEPMRRELDALLKVSTIKHVLSPVPPVVISLNDALHISLENVRKQ